jgi:hypothetical protein
MTTALDTVEAAAIAFVVACLFAVLPLAAVVAWLMHRQQDLPELPKARVVRGR